MTEQEMVLNLRKCVDALSILRDSVGHDSLKDMANISIVFLDKVTQEIPQLVEAQKDSKRLGWIGALLQRNESGNLSVILNEVLEDTPVMLILEHESEDYIEGSAIGMGRSFEEAIDNAMEAEQ